MPEQAVRVRKLVTTLTAAVVLATGAAACSADDTSDLPPPASPPPAAVGSPTPGLDLSPEELAAVEEARTKFDEFMNAYIEVSTADLPTAETAEALFAQVDQHVGGGELSQELRAEIVGRWGDREFQDGSLVWSHVEALEVDLRREIDGHSSPLVALRYCVDATNWRSVAAETREPSGPSGERHGWSAVVVWSDDWFGQGIAGWRVRERRQLEEQC